MLLEHLRETEETLIASADLQTAFLDDLADHMSTTAEVDEGAQLRTRSSVTPRGSALMLAAREPKSWRRLRTCAGAASRSRLGSKKPPHRHSRSGDRISESGRGGSADRNRDRKEAAILLIVASRTAEGSTNLRVIRPDHEGPGRQAGRNHPAVRRDFRWSADQLVTIFEATGAEIAARVQQIAGWLGDGGYGIETDGAAEIVKTHTTVLVVEHAEREAAIDLIARIELESHQELVAG